MNVLDIELVEEVQALAAKSKGLTKFERDVLETVETQIENDQPLSDKQRKILENALAESNTPRW